MIRGSSYAPDVAQVWRATGDHHDEFSSTLKQVRTIPLSFSLSLPPPSLPLPLPLSLCVCAFTLRTHLLEQVDSVKGKSTWSGPHNWAYVLRNTRIKHRLRL